MSLNMPTLFPNIAITSDGVEVEISLLDEDQISYELSIKTDKGPFSIILTFDEICRVFSITAGNTAELNVLLKDAISFMDSAALIGHLNGQAEP